MTVKAIQRTAGAGVPAPPRTRFGRSTTAQANSSSKEAARGPAPPATKFGVLARVQTKSAAGWLGRGAVRPLPPVTSARDATLQLARKKGVAGGAGGLGYGNAADDIAAEDMDEVLERAGLEKKGGAKGHWLGNQGSGESDQTKRERAKMVAANREIKAEKKTTKDCANWHRSKRNYGKKCPFCDEIVED